VGQYDTQGSENTRAIGNARTHRIHHIHGEGPVPECTQGSTKNRVGHVEKYRGGDHQHEPGERMHSNRKGDKHQEEKGDTHCETDRKSPELVGKVPFPGTFFSLQ